MNITNVLIYEPYPFSEVAGNLRTLSYILEFLDKKALCPVLLAPLESDFTKKTEEKGVRTLIVEPPERVNRYGGKCLRDGYVGKLLTVWGLFLYNLQIFKVLKRESIDVIYCNCIRGVLTLGLAAILARVPMLWYVKGELQNPFLDAIGFILSAKILYFCETNKNDCYPFLVNIYQKKIEILKIGIDPRVIEEVEQADPSSLIAELNVRGDTINCVYIGQIYAPKGIHYLLEAVASIKDEFPNIHLYIVGDHIIEEYREYKDRLLEIINKYNISKNITFTGWRPDALQIVSVMDILIHPSLHEGFGRAVLEGMALGRPVIATKVGGLREIVRDGENGYLVDTEDAEAIAQKLKILIGDKDLRDKFGKAAKETVFADYRIQDKVLRLQDIWRSMASQE
jgi:glycosyltransferase involved in cell wall biosynthesis